MEETKSKYRQEKQCIVTMHLATARGLELFLGAKLPGWKNIKDHVKILLICGAHGEEDGSIKEEDKNMSSYQSLKVSLQNISLHHLTLKLCTFQTFFFVE